MTRANPSARKTYARPFQVKIFMENNYGSNGEYAGLDVKIMRTQKIENCYQRLANSLRVVGPMEEKMKKFDYGYQRKCVEARDYKALELYVVALLLKSCATGTIT